MDDDPDTVRGPYSTARIAAAFALVGAVVFMLIVDPFVASYQADPIIVTSLLGAAAALLGVEIIDFVRRPRP